MSPRRVRLRSLAKINLDLRVLHKRADGFHELRTVFQTVSLADRIEIEYTHARRTSVQLESLVQIPNNLILRAADLVLEATKRTGQLRFRLEKHIPMGGGLGGGSSNAASMLLALPVLIGKRLPLEILLDLASRLGSDVPFFLFGGTALAIGRGTELYPAPEAPSRPVVLITPEVHVSTPEAYRGLNRQAEPDQASQSLESFQALLWHKSAAGKVDYQSVRNDFETVVFAQHPQLQSMKGKLLKAGARPALMSGSGSTLFGIFRDRRKRDHAASVLRREFGEGKVKIASLVTRNRYRSLWWRQLGAHTETNTWPPQSRYLK
ncbi:MAG: 4-(cytidine 5'-diphospho)-2-C-methyl-D-erythritol kinase [Acidobacteriaceae bacterium]|nr:4-(cytidine 5'-diphospho)-2-C-methyl-D-erythritol kinase [Acidobacteriaceae bacterium]